jgi:hypothetical protein
VGYSAQQQHQYQSNGLPQQAPAPPSNNDASYIVANLLSLLPGGSQASGNHPNNSYGSNRGGRAG